MDGSIHEHITGPSMRNALLRPFTKSKAKNLEALLDRCTSPSTPTIVAHVIQTPEESHELIMHPFGYLREGGEGGLGVKVRVRMIE